MKSLDGAGDRIAAVRLIEKRLKAEHLEQMARPPTLQLDFFRHQVGDAAHLISPGVVQDARKSSMRMRGAVLGNRALWIRGHC